MKHSKTLKPEELKYQTGTEAYKNYNYINAVDCFKSAKAMSKKNGNKKMEMHSSLLLADSLYKSRNINESLKELKYCQNYIHRYGSNEMRIDWNIVMSAIKLAEGNTANALVYIENCNHLNIELYPIKLQNYLKMRIHCYTLLGIYNIAIQECKRGLEIIDKSSQFTSYIYYKKSILECEEMIDIENQNIDAWWALWDETEEHTALFGVQLQRSQILSSMMYTSINANLSKKERYKIANLFHKKIENSDYKSSSEYLNLISLYTKMEDYQKADEILTKYKNTPSNTNKIPINQMIEGIQQYLIDRNLKEPKIAEESFQNLINKVKKEDFSKLGITHRMEIYFEISNLYKLRLDYKKALEYSEKHIQEIIQDKRESSNILREHISVLLEENKNKKSLNEKEFSENQTNKKQSLLKENLEKKQFFHSKQFMVKVGKLASELPQLSPTELKISVLIGSNFTNYEIMETIGISIRTVEKHRLEIRKKMKLTQKSNLVVRLLNILSK